MPGAGNDIVALKAIDVNRTKQSNFYSKIIVPQEKSLHDRTLSTVLPLEHLVWLAWSIKESVYKFLQRDDHDLVFSPSKINIEQIVAPAKTFAGLQTEGMGFDAEVVYSGIVKFGNHILYSRSVITDDY